MRVRRIPKSKADAEPQGAAERRQPRVPQKDIKASAETVVRRPDKDVPRDDGPEVKPVAGDSDAEAPKASVRAGTLFVTSDDLGKPAAGDGKLSGRRQQKPPKKVVLLPVEDRQVRYPHPPDAPAPLDKALQKTVVTAYGAGRERQISAGFMLGIALIVVALLSGIFIVRLNRQVDRLETRISRLENPELRAVAGHMQIP